MSNLLVQNIKHTNGTTAQTIDSNGRINISNVPRMSCYHNTDGTVNVNNNESFFQSSVTFRHQTGITYSNDSNGRFTVPMSGVYFIHFQTIVYDRAVDYQIKHNDTRIKDGYIQGDGKGWSYLDMSTTFTASANDYFTIILASQSGGSGGHANGHGGIAHNTFDIMYVGG